jgi:hypothetical protein
MQRGMKCASASIASTKAFPLEVFRAANFGLTHASFTLQAGWTVFIMGAIEE